VSEPKRIRLHGTPRARALLAAARRYEPSGTKQAQMLAMLDAGGIAGLPTATDSAGAALEAALEAGEQAASVGAGGAAPLGTTAAATGAGSTLLLKAAAWSTALIVAGSAVWMGAARSPAPDERASEESSRRQPLPSGKATASPVAETPTRDADLHLFRHRMQCLQLRRPRHRPQPRPGKLLAQYKPKELPVQDRSLLRTTRSSPRAVARKRPRSTEEGREALSSGRPREALRLLEILARGPAHPSLALEREVLTIESLAASGQADSAAARARAFVAAHPRSLLADRLRPLAGTSKSPSLPDSPSTSSQSGAQ
jgi:hypothetical protein